MIIHQDVNVKNWLKKEYVIKDLFGTLAIVSVNVTNHVMLRIFRLWNCRCRKKLVDKLVQESSKNID